MLSIIFDTKTEYLGLAVIGFENEDIIQQLIVDISFFLIFLHVEKFLVVIVGLGNSLKNEYYRAGVGFISSFIIRYHDAQHLFLLKIEEEHCLLEIYLELTCIKQIIGEILDNV